MRKEESKEGHRKQKLSIILNCTYILEFLFYILNVYFQKFYFFLIVITSNTTNPDPYLSW